MRHHDTCLGCSYPHIYCGPGYDRLYGYNGWLVSQPGCEEMPDD